MSETQRHSTDVGNYYGCIEIKEDMGKFFIAVENWNGYRWHEISRELFELIKEELCS